MFGEANVPLEAEKVKIYNDNGQEESMSFSIAYRTVYRQSMTKLSSIPRLFLLEPLTDWCLTPFERRVRHNQTVIRQFLLDKFNKHNEWRKSNKISTEDNNSGESNTEDNSIIAIADLIMADSKKFADEDDIADELITAFFGVSQTTISATCQVFYQNIKDSASRKKILEELQSSLKIEGSENEQVNDELELTAESVS